MVSQAWCYISCFHVQELKSVAQISILIDLRPPFVPHSPLRDHTYVGLLPYTKLQIAHAPGMPGTFSPPPWVSDPDMHRDMCVTHVLWCIPESLTRGFLWSRWRGKRSWHSRHMRNLQFYVSGKRPMHSSSPSKLLFLSLAAYAHLIASHVIKAKSF